MRAHGKESEVPINHTELSFGGALAVLEEKSGGTSAPVSLRSHVDEFLTMVLMLPKETEGEGEGGTGAEGDTDTDATHLISSSSWRQHIAVMYTFGIFVTKDYEHPFGLEIGLMDEIRWGVFYVGGEVRSRIDQI